MKKSDDPGDKAQQPFNNPFSALSAKKDALPPGPVAKAPAPAVKEIRGPARAVVRYERKGHGGKEVTVVEQLCLSNKEMEKWLKELKQSLGCGGAIDGTALMLQGDQRERLRVILEKRGVKKISVS